MPELPGAPTAAEIFKRKTEDGTYTEQGHYDWEAFCVAGDYCCRPCSECRQDGCRARETAIDT